MTRIDFPLQFDGRGRTAQTDREAYVRDLILQVLLTSPGERVMRPSFGSGLMQLVFAGASPEIAATTQFLVQGALQQWLGDVIAVQSVEVQPLDGALNVEVEYIDLQTQTSAVARFSTPGGGAP